GAIAECFNRLCRKREAIQRVKIDQRDFSISLQNKQGAALPKSRLSAGEKQIFAIATLWALARTSGRPLPLVIDTPLGRLDTAHRRLLVDYYFPVASHQVIVLSTDTEVDQTYFAGLQRSVSRSYQLVFDSADRSTSIQEGYFWR